MSFQAPYLESLIQEVWKGLGICISNRFSGDAIGPGESLRDRCQSLSHRYLYCQAVLASLRKPPAVHTAAASPPVLNTPFPSEFPQAGASPRRSKHRGSHLSRKLLATFLQFLIHLTHGLLKIGIHLQSARIWKDILHHLRTGSSCWILSRVSTEPAQ